MQHQPKNQIVRLILTLCFAVIVIISIAANYNNSSANISATISESNSFGPNGPSQAPFQSPLPTPTPSVPWGSDIYENDDGCYQARVIDNTGIPQEHTFHAAGDEDWVAFNGTAGTRYRIEVEIPGESDADVDMSVHTNCDTLPSALWNETFAPGVRMEFQSPNTGLIYIRLTNYDTAVGGADHAYRVNVRTIPNDAQTGVAIILAGRLLGEDNLQQNIHNSTAAFYEALLANGYVKEDIYYLATDSALTGYDAPATLENVRLAITDWARQRVSADRALTIYTIDHGDRDLFFVDDTRGDRLTPAMLDGWLDELQAAVPGTQINVIIEACHAGSFIDGPDTISGPGRVIISSTNVANDAYASRHGAYFSDHFISYIRQGYDLFSSFWYAKEQVFMLNDLQEPWLDADGDAVVNEMGDFVIAAQRGFGSAGSFSDAWPPYIANAEEPEGSARALKQAGNDFTRVIEAEVRDNFRVRDVWAVIYPPSYVAPRPSRPNSQQLVQEPEQAVLLQHVGNNRYAVSYGGFTERGTYTIHIHAVDDDGLEAAPVVMQIQNGSTLYLPMIQQ
ncbi:MAG: hypothetical protein AAF639_45795 [Chloroflexota bacterium]